MRRAFADIRPLRESADYRRLWIGTSAQGFGRQVASVTVLYQVWELTGSPLWVGVVGLVHAVPMVVMTLVGGVLADLTDRKRLVVWTTAIAWVTSLGLVAQAFLDVGSLALLLGVLAVQTTATSLGAPARRTLIPRLLPPARVGAGIALMHLSFQASMLAGPAVAGVAIAEGGLATAYRVEAVAFVVSLYGVARLPSMRPERAPDTSVTGLRLVREGIGFVARTKVVAGAFWTDLSATVLAMPMALFPAINEDRFGGDPRTLGLFLSSVAVGGLVAGLLSGWVVRQRRLGTMQLWAAGVWCVALAGVGLAGSLPLLLALLAVAGAADTVRVVSRASLLQLATPDAVRGRVSSVEQVVGVAGPEVGNFRAGVMGSALSPAMAMTGGGLLALAGVVAVAATNRPLRDFRTPTGPDTADGGPVSP